MMYEWSNPIGGEFQMYKGTWTYVNKTCCIKSFYTLRYLLAIPDRTYLLLFIVQRSHQALHVNLQLLVRMTVLDFTVFQFLFELFQLSHEFLIFCSRVWFGGWLKGIPLNNWIKNFENIDLHVGSLWELRKRTFHWKRILLSSRESAVLKNIN